ncbi:hypothetical protein [Niabella drilacis]|uniref:Tetratricopeptide repeat-containing protein n=1 Tax=Niabella drilacis (strain DSM 25811 / CCM 8410 / CCUG 62505 / LMG 26954 / E90) TaxID=1285928 RepID=A0A1G6J6W3_NIADE|nr:hypothetical protein [Niabella drilacis]SDC14075.1 hypothetical protein SAMN04487894_101430 [Niabella drilacis]
MNHFINTIAWATFPHQQQPMPVAALEQLARQYPYAPALQLLLAARLKETQDPGFAGQWQKTLLYFKDPLLLQYQFFAEQQRPASGIPPASAHDTEVQQADAEAGPDTSEAPIPIPGLKLEPLDTAKANLLFTPYYTVDYFASQGIQLSDDNNTGDRFGSQLKSFTSWLKEMRRLPEATSGIRFSIKNEAVIEKMAEKSLNGQNEETAAMAEVWAKQGNKAKAIEIYQKLSLLNPSKRAYFAAKIEHLKK